MDNKQIEKNIKDLTYSQIIGWENISLVLLGTAIVTIIFSPQERPLAIAKITWLSFLVPALGITLRYFEKRTKNILVEIRALKE